MVVTKHPTGTLIIVGIAIKHIAGRVVDIVVFKKDELLAAEIRRFGPWTISHTIGIVAPVTHLEEEGVTHIRRGKI